MSYCFQNEESAPKERYEARKIWLIRLIAFRMRNPPLKISETLCIGTQTHGKLHRLVCLIQAYTCSAYNNRYVQQHMLANLYHHKQFCLEIAACDRGLSALGSQLSRCPSCPIHGFALLHIIIIIIIFIIIGLGASLTDY